MQIKRLIKTLGIILLILVAGILYSCSTSREQTLQVSLQEQYDSMNQDYESKDNNSHNQIEEANPENSSKITQETPLDKGLSGENHEKNQDKNQEDIQKKNQDKNQEDIQKMNQDENQEDLNKVDTTTKDREYIYVHICGAVNNPDVYEVIADTRLCDVIKLAGGLSVDAAGDYINQAALVCDGERYYIPTKSEVSGINPIESITTSGSKSLNKNDVNRISNKDVSNNKVNINTAALEELMTLPGIGESKANSIVSYRQEQGVFQSIEDIMNITGIKDSVYEKIKEYITVK